MENILTIMGAALGILVPILFGYTIIIGIKKSQFEESKKAKYKRSAIVIMILWTVLVWLASLTGIISYHEGDVIPRFFVPLFIPVIAGLFLLSNKDFRNIVSNIPVPTLVGVQAFRLAGFAFLIISGLGILPKAFASGGYGDILTGSLAIIASLMLLKNSKTSKLFFAAFNIAGLFDLLNVATLLVFYYPIWNESLPSSAAAADFSLVMIPALAAPIALILHIYSIRNFWLENKLKKVELQLN